ncbi:Plasmodium exported protein (Pm-fam-a like), unknown function [Plasmodium malariae]|uniref:Uncharacterized protein n=1 Tax=Plasmodium malariae TaxID=5858 RepID=A0A1A8WJ09_PLAMA|nr:Plasmodium exported protein (Pm-fam-a like), unknown function [Plasmodium malariae]
MSRFKKILDEYYGPGIKLNKGIYRLLGKCEKGVFSNVRDLDLKIPNNKKKTNEQLFTNDIEKWEEEKKEKLYRSKLIKEKLIKKLMKNKYTMLHRTYTYYEKKIMNGLNDKAFFKKMILINDKEYKKLKRKKYGLRLFFLILFFAMVITIPILGVLFGESLKTLCSTSGSGGEPPNPSGSPASSGSWLSSFFSFCLENPISSELVYTIIIYCVPILILGIILILCIFYYYKRAIKNKKIKFLEEFNEW